jgi:hypothetical protein
MSKINLLLNKYSAQFIASNSQMRSAYLAMKQNAIINEPIRVSQHEGEDMVDASIRTFKELFFAEKKVPGLSMLLSIEDRTLADDAITSEVGKINELIKLACAPLAFPLMFTATSNKFLFSLREQRPVLTVDLDSKLAEYKKRLAVPVTA